MKYKMIMDISKYIIFWDLKKSKKEIKINVFIWYLSYFTLNSYNYYGSILINNYVL
jgi:hypothetical protein